MKKAWALSYPQSAQRRLWSDWVNAQADLSLRWAHSHFVGFVTKRLICSMLHYVESFLWPELLTLVLCFCLLLNTVCIVSSKRGKARTIKFHIIKWKKIERQETASEQPDEQLFPRTVVTKLTSKYHVHTFYSTSSERVSKHSVTQYFRTTCGNHLLILRLDKSYPRPNE